MGLLAGVLIGYFTEYFTSDTYKPTQKLAQTSKTGPATIIIGGISLGMMSTIIPILIIGVAIILSYNFAGLYGIGLAAVGMLSTLGITLATDAYGPIADNAGGIAEMAHLDAKVRERTDALDLARQHHRRHRQGLCHRFGRADRACPDRLLYRPGQAAAAHVQPRAAQHYQPQRHGRPVRRQRAALHLRRADHGICRQSRAGIVVEVRRQFKEIVGLMDGKAEPDYASCVSICTSAAQREMIIPSVLAVAAPIIAGFFLGVYGVAGMLLGSTITGFILAIMLSNAGGAWDNAKKHIEAGNLGGKGSEEHKAAGRRRHGRRPVQGYVGPCDQHPHQARIHFRDRIPDPDYVDRTGISEYMFSLFSQLRGSRSGAGFFIFEIKFGGHNESFYKTLFPQSPPALAECRFLNKEENKLPQRP